MQARLPWSCDPGPLASHNTGPLAWFGRSVGWGCAPHWPVRTHGASRGCRGMRPGWDRWEPRDLDDARAFEARSWFVETHVAASGFSYRKDGWISIGAWLRSVAGVDEGAFFSLDDIRPMLGVAGRPAVRATARLGGRSRR